MTYPYVAGAVLLASDLNTDFAAKTDTAMTQNAQTGTTYSFALADASKLLTTSNASPVSVTVTKQATVTWVTGTQLRIVNLGAGVTTLVADTGVTINNNKALAQYQGGTLIRTASDVWTFQPTGGGKILQVVSTTKSDSFTTSSTSLVDVTGLSVSITPANATNTCLVTVSMSLHNALTGYVSVGNLLRGATEIGGGTAVGSRGSANIRMRVQSNGDSFSPGTFTFLDSPASTSAQTYKMQVRTASGGTATVGYSAGADSNNNEYPRFASTITVMEISA